MRTDLFFIQKVSIDEILIQNQNSIKARFVEIVYQKCFIFYPVSRVEIEFGN